MHNGRIAICMLAVAMLACQLVTGNFEAPPTQLSTTAAPVNPSYAPTAQTAKSQTLLSQNGPWIVFSESDGLYAANMDGSAATKVFDLAPYLKLDPTPYIKLSSIATTGGRFAIITANDYTGTYGLTLHIIHLPDGKEEKTIALTGPQSEPMPNAPPGDPRRYPLQAYGTGQWSADGSQLAFEAGIDGDSSDLYLYSTVDGSVKRLTSGAAQDYAPNWSPDGKYIVHFGTGSWGTGAGYHMLGAWATLVGKASTYDLYTPESGGEDVLGWLDDQTVILYSSFTNCSMENIRAINISTRKEKSLWKGAFQRRSDCL